jgi:hypothetical protein
MASGDTRFSRTAVAFRANSVSSRAVVKDSPEARQQLQSLIDQMRNLDPRRFPGNPAMVELMHQQLVSNVDALELQLRRQLDENRGGTIRNTDPAKVPAGYRDSVAE